MKKEKNRIRAWAFPLAAALSLVMGHDPVASGADAPRETRTEERDTGSTLSEDSRPSESGSERGDAPESSRRQRLQEIVSVGSNATVGPNQTASDVVVVHGDAAIEGEVRGDLVVVFGTARITGRVRGDLVVVLGEAEIDGRVDGDTSLILTRSRFGPQARTEGEVTAFGVPPDVDAAARLKLEPEIVSVGPLMSYFEGAKEYLFQGILWLRPFPPRVGWVWIAAGVFLVFHLMLAIILPRPLRECVDSIREQPARSFLVGMLACVLVGPVSLLLSFTVIAPLVIWIAFVAACVFGRVAAYGAAGAAVGRVVGMNAATHPVGPVLLGSLVLYVTYMIPVVGLLVYGLVLPLGIGAVLIRVFDALRSERPPAIPGPRGTSYAAASGLMAGNPGPATHGFVPESVSVGPATAAPPVAGAATSSESATTVPPLVPDSGTASGPVPPRTPPPPSPPSPPAAEPRVIPLAAIEALASPRVGFWPRLGASAIDLLLIGVINIATFKQAEAFWFLLAAYHLCMWAWKGTTLGGSVMNLRVVRLDGRAMDWQTAVVRVLGAVVSLAPLGLGFFWASWDAEFQSWHDRIAGTTIVKPERRVSLV